MFFSRNKPYIRVKILSARDLVPHDSDGYVDPCVTVEVGGDTESTSTMSECLAPVWNEGFNFRINPDRPPLEVVLRCNDDRLLRRNRLLGMVRIPLHDFFDGNTPRLYRSGGQFTEQSIPMVDPRTKGYAGSLTVKYGWCFSIEDYYRPEFQENWMRMMQNLEQMRFRDHPSSFDNYYGESFHPNGRFPRSNSTHHHGPHPSYGYPQDHWRSGHGQFSHSRAQGSYPEGSPEPPHPMRSSSFHRPGEESGHYRGGTGSHSPGPSFAPGHEQSHYDFGGGASQYPGSSGFGMGNAAGGGGYNSEFGSRMGHGSMPYGAPPPPPFMGPGGIPPMNGGMGGGPPNGFGAVPSFQGGMRSSYPPPPPPPFPNMPGMRPMMPPQNHEFPPFAAPGYAAPPHFM
ncbi:Ras GTPase-activating protein 4 [Dispira parvispora]|uniref:Ras GTPase-activating protein 4 n=1 Tax=Dispira parvispora TaxID=1520584 RepID=A0A9W8ASK2_9FUNG|nr:Ras GTPase-activating protein 4 [Dispira parvispora]